MIKPFVLRVVAEDDIDFSDLPEEQRTLYLVAIAKQLSPQFYTWASRGRIAAGESILIPSFPLVNSPYITDADQKAFLERVWADDDAVPDRGLQG